MVYFIKGALIFLWGLGCLTAGILSILLIWSLVADLKPRSFGLEIGQGNFRIFDASPDPSHNLVIFLPVAMESVDRNASMPKVHGNYRFRAVDRSFLSASLAILLILVGLGLTIVDQLRNVFLTLEAKDPFRSENAMRIRRIGACVMVLDIVQALAVAYWSGSAQVEGWRAASRIGAPALVYLLLILALAEVFREGARLREEQSLTI